MHFLKSIILGFAVASLATALPSAALFEKRDDKQVLLCLRAMDTSGLSGSYGEKQWNDVHGDSKSKDECIFDSKKKLVYNIQVTHDSDGTYRVRILQGRSALKTVEVPPCKAGKKPTLGRAIHALRKAYGGPSPPVC
jgi:hypothetical protein